MRQPDGVQRVRAEGVIRTTLLIALVAAFGTALGMGWASSRQSEHVASAVVMLHPLEGNAYSPGGRGDELVNLETEAQVLRSDAVARVVLAELGETGSAEELLSAVDVEVPANTQLLEITARGPDDAAATRRASTFASVYLEYRRARTLAAVADRTSRMKELLAVREDERSEALVQLDASEPGAPARSLLQQQVEELTLQIGSLRAELVASQSVSLDPGQIVTPGRPDVPGLDARREVMATVGGAAAAALALAVLAARSGERRVERVGSSEDLEEMGPPVLDGASATGRLDGSAVSRMRSATLSAGPDRPLVVAVAAVGSHPSIGHQSLVDSLVRARYELVLVDLCAPGPAAAMAELVREEVSVDDVLRPEGQFLSSLGPAAPDDGGEATGGVPIELEDLAASTGMRRSLHELAKRAELVVVRSPGLGTPVGRSILTACDAVLVEVPLGQVSRRDVEEVLSEAARAHCTVAGLVPVRLTRGRPGRPGTVAGEVADA